MQRPLWGFGWVGWCLLPVLLALVWVVATGYDLRFQLQKLINDTLGPSANTWFTNHLIVFNGIGLWDPGLGLVTLLYLLAAMHIHPRRVSWPWYLVIALWASLRAPMLSWLLVAIRIVKLDTALGMDPCLVIAMVLLAALDACILWWITRSLLVTGFAVVVSLVYIIVIWQVIFQSGMADILAVVPWGWLWHVGLAGVLAWWAIQGRRNVRLPHQCQACGYDLRALSGDRCPECGAAKPAAAQPAQQDTGVHSPS